MSEEQMQALEKFWQDFDFLFQEGVVFKKEQIKKIRDLTIDINSICDDYFLLTE